MYYLNKSSTSFKKKINMERILSLSMRPKTLDDIIGQDVLVDSLKNQFSSKRIPHFFIIEGPVGIGKTTIARIIALCLQTTEKNFTNLDWKRAKQYEIMEINAANKNGVDDIRNLAENVKYKPVPPSISRVVILDEAHQLTNAAQNALITETEDTYEHLYFIFCTSALSKIIPALKRRASILSPKALDLPAIFELLKKAKNSCNFHGDVSELASLIYDTHITSPGIILQIAERFFSGLTASESVLYTDTTKLECIELCRAVSTGDWKKCSSLLKTVSKSDVFSLKIAILGYLKTILLNSSGTKAHNTSKAINTIADVNVEDSISVSSLIANVYLACEYMSGTVTAKITSTVKKTTSASGTTPSTTPSMKTTTSTTSTTKQQDIPEKKQETILLDEKPKKRTSPVKSSIFTSNKNSSDSGVKKSKIK